MTQQQTYYGQLLQSNQIVLVLYAQKTVRVQIDGQPMSALLVFNEARRYITR